MSDLKRCKDCEHCKKKEVRKTICRWENRYYCMLNSEHMSGNRVGDSNRISLNATSCDSFKPKYSCPVCGSPIRYWNEYLVYKTQLINPITGALSKVSKSDLDENLGDMHGFECTQCTWCLNDVNESIPNILEEWYENHEKNIKV